uniref:F-box domain-containing protein n=1 Tax=Strongyloides venezuelensis TaxID=75913 RepID=A0A0K0EYK5_STRVS
MMDFDFLSLPPEILGKIFSNIPWNELINVRLCARKFNYVINKYHKDMQKPKLKSIIFENDSTHNEGIDRIRIAYEIHITDMHNFKDTSDEKEFFLFPSELDQFQGFLKKVDLTSLDCVDISLYDHAEVVGIFSDYFHNTNRIESICLYVSNSEEDIGNTLSFLEKVQNVEVLELCLHLPHINIPKDFIIPVKNSLEVIDIWEEGDTAFVNPRMIKHIVENNPDLCGFKFTLNNFETYKMIIDTIVEGELSRRTKGCLHRHITLILCISSDEASFELLNYFDSEEFPYSRTNIRQEGDILYIGRLVCPVCGRFDTISVHKGDFY